MVGGGWVMSKCKILKNFFWEKEKNHYVYHAMWKIYIYINMYIYIYILFFLQSCEASWWRACYQRGLPHLFFTKLARWAAQSKCCHPLLRGFLSKSVLVNQPTVNGRVREGPLKQMQLWILVSSQIGLNHPASRIFYYKTLREKIPHTGDKASLDQCG